MPSPPSSPPSECGLDGPRGAAHAVAEECERLFCETLAAVFGEGKRAVQGSTATGAHVTAPPERGARGIAASSRVKEARGAPLTPSQSPDTILAIGDAPSGGHRVERWVEVFDYVCDVKFRGFVASAGPDRTLFVFFEERTSGKDLKPGLVALLELCDVEDIACSKAVACLDRHADHETVSSFSRDLGWVGFEPYTLVEWTSSDDIISHDWLFLSINV